MKFKVGDKVRYIEHVVNLDEDNYMIGNIYEIESIENFETTTYDPQLYLKGFNYNWVCKSQIELVRDVTEELEETLGDNIVTQEMLDFFNKPSKDNSDKPMMSLVRPEYIEGIAEVLSFGARKYKEERRETLNYLRGDGFHYSEIYDSLQRHLNTWATGESFDDETKLNHLLHAASNIMFLYAYEIGEKGVDDRFGLRKEDESKE